MPARNNTAPTNPCRIWLLCPVIILALGTGACGSGDPQEAVGTASQVTEIDTAPNSTAIVDHRAPDGFQFAQFREYQIHINEAAAADLVGDYYVIKVFHLDQTFYLGTHPSVKDITLQLSLPLTLSSVSIEIFTNQPQAGVVTSEITL